MRILLLSAYDAQSHQYWRNGLVHNLPEFNWTVLTLPPRYFAWRVRGNALSWLIEQQDILSKQYDLIIATSMVDLAGLKGLVPSLAATPSLVYFHENQFEYPESGHEQGSVEPQMMSIFTTLAASNIVFNSEFNKTTFLAGVKRLFKKLPDHKPKNINQLLFDKASVLPVPLSSIDKYESSLIRNISSDTDKLVVVWNHRWEFDKGPERLYDTIKQTVARSNNVVFHIAGQQFRHSPDVFNKIKQDFGQYIGEFGFIDDKQHYRDILLASDVVLSTALHDFQGLSVLEGVQSNCTPLLPNALVYPEYFDKQFLYDVDKSAADNCADQLAHWAQLKLAGKLPKAPSIEPFTWHKLADSYRNLILATAKII